MICKKDVILWFKELESYKRIDMMCTLLNMCLPFELRFLGTCLEELGRRDSQELRGIELRVNNPQDLATDMIACQKGEPTDKKIRRKMALYLALIRACNRSCVTEIFRTLEGWGEREFYIMNDLDTLQELLLVYTMAANHPVFSFEQHMHCTEIFDKIHANKLLHEESNPLHTCVQLQPLTNKHANEFVQHKTDIRYHIPPTQQDIMSQELNIHAIHIAEQHHQMQTVPIPIIPQGCMTVTSPNSHITKQMPASPILSQQSSPSSSRAASPNTKMGNSENVIIQQSLQSQHSASSQLRNIPHRISVSLKNIRSPSTETTPPALVPPHQHISSEIILPHNIKQIDEMIINTDASMTQLQTLIRNGFGRNASHHKHKTANFLAHYHQQLPSNQHFSAVTSGNFAVNAGFAYSMQNMALMEGPYSLDTSLIEQHQNKCMSSDSGSSIGSCGEISPPETPSLITNTSSSQATIWANDQVHSSQQNPTFIGYSNRRINQKRGTERAEKNLATTSRCGNSSGALIFTPSSNANIQTASVQQQYLGTDIILAQTACSNAACIMQSSIASNNIANSATNLNTGGVTAINTSSSNNNIVNSVLINSPSTTGSSGIIGNVITSNSVVQQKYNGSFPYYGASAQHLTTPVRTTVPQNPGIGHVQTTSFRMQPFQIPSNGEIMYPAYHPAGLAFLSGGLSAGTSAITLRTSTSSNANQTAAISPHGNALQQQQHILTSNMAQNASPYTSQSKGPSKPISCYNCGSHTHNGRECQESSMDDVCRNSIYKLDYSVSPSKESPVTRTYPQSNISQVAVSSNIVVSGNGSDSNIHKIQKSHIVDIGKKTVTTAISSTP